MTFQLAKKIEEALRIEALKTVKSDKLIFKYYGKDSKQELKSFFKQYNLSLIIIDRTNNTLTVKVLQ